MKDHPFFVNIKTVFDRLEDRNIEKLSSLYDDLPFLKSLVSDVINNQLEDEMVRGKRVLLKPNWVLHNCKENDEICMRTHDNFLIAALEVILKKNPASVLIGDAPVQGCKWEKVIRPDFIKEVERISTNYHIPVQIHDFRRVTFDPSSNNLTVERNGLSNYVIFDLGQESYLEPISIEGKNLFRVTDYNPDRLAEMHRPKMHKYCITKELFENDIIITIPKVKTHQKAGITNALKILVGINGDKDYLPHHRKGGTKNGGDCYPGSNIFRKLSEKILDTANRHRGQLLYLYIRRISSLIWKLSNPTPKHNLAASWYGNDTTWRMTMDINKIAEFGRKDGTISHESQRILFSLSDGIIGGQGNGPLKADPLPLGIVCFSNISSMTDAAMSIIMGFDEKKIPLVKAALENDKKKRVKLILNDKIVELFDLQKISIKTIPPPGWVGYL